MCLAQGPQHNDAVWLEPAAPRSRVKHSTTEPLRSLLHICDQRSFALVVKLNNTDVHKVCRLAEGLTLLQFPFSTV